MIAAIEAVPAMGGIAALIGAVGGAYAVVMARTANERAADAAEELAKVTERTATREETQQALDAQSVLIERQDKRIVYLEARNAELHIKINDVLGKLAVTEASHRRCEEMITKLTGDRGQD